MSDKIALRASGVYKDFLLPYEKAGSLKSLVVGRSRSRKGKQLQHALKDISFEVNKGEFFGIVGRNGSGKSTLLKILAGIYQPNQGQIETNGKLVPFIELGVGFNPELTGRENIYLNGALLGFSENEISSMYDDIVSFAELGPFMDQRLKNYSSGMQVRLAFSVAVRAKADILLIDEVLAVGDADFQRKCFNYFSQLRRDKVTVIFVSHDMDAVREYCDRAMLIDNNEVKAIGPTSEVADKYIRLFTEDHSHDAPEDVPDNRWGDFSLKITDISANSDANKISIVMNVKATEDIERPIAGFRLRDGVGRDLTGTNTKIERKQLPDFKKGDKAVITWQLPNVFKSGDYMVDATLQHADLHTVADWWNSAASLSINKAHQLPYTVDPGFDFKIVKE